MPYLNVKLATEPVAETSRKVATALTDLTVELLKKKRELTAVTVEYLPVTDWFVGGQALSAHGVQSFYLDIRVTDGTNTKDDKARYVASVFEAMEQSLGPVHPTSYIVIHEVQGDSWGYQGKTQEYRYISAQNI